MDHEVVDVEESEEKTSTNIVHHQKLNTDATQEDCTAEDLDFDQIRQQHEKSCCSLPLLICLGIGVLFLFLFVIMFTKSGDSESINKRHSKTSTS